eukprot:PhM_4_TR16964/c0_g1_i1/m.22323/K15442/TAD3, ADAT3; tRNA-specific adenosine deaminase 3
MCVVDVPKEEPRNAVEWAAASAVWPVTTPRPSDPQSILSTLPLDEIHRFMAVARSVAADDGDAGIGACIVNPQTGQVVATARCTLPLDSPGFQRAYGDGGVCSNKNSNSCVTDVYQHAVMRAVREANAKAVDYLCTGCDVYTTHEPCTMCMMALVHSRTRRLYFGVRNGALGGVVSQHKVPMVRSLNHHLEWIVGGL